MVHKVNYRKNKEFGTFISLTFLVWLMMSKSSYMIALSHIPFFFFDSGKMFRSHRYRRTGGVDGGVYSRAYY
jgi:hypothetical protein